jgi:hypothetical protein
MSDLLKLAERCETATGPDRELDALIWCALNGKKYIGHHQAYAAYRSHSPETQVEFTEPPKRERLVSTGKALPHAQPVTASLDAAMTLVPWEKLDARGFYFVLDRDYQSGRWIARFDQAGDECGHGETYIAEGNTAALALCAAALKARASMSHGEKQ